MTGVQSVAKTHFSLCHHVQTGLGVLPTSSPVGSRCPYTGKNQPKHLSYYLPKCSAKLRVWSLISTPSYSFITWWMSSDDFSLNLCLFWQRFVSGEVTCFSLLWSKFKVRVFWSYVNLIVFKNSEGVCTTLHKKPGKIRLKYITWHNIWWCSNLLSVSFWVGLSFQWG